MLKESLRMTYKKKTARFPGGFLKSEVNRLGALYVDCAWALLGLFDLEADHFAFAEVVEGNSNETGGVEEDILVTTLWGDETESLVCQTLDCTCHSFK